MMGTIKDVDREHADRRAVVEDALRYVSVGTFLSAADIKRRAASDMSAGQIAQWLILAADDIYASIPRDDWYEIGRMHWTRSTGDRGNTVGAWKRKMSPTRPGDEPS